MIVGIWLAINEEILKMAKKIVQMKELVSKNPDVYDDIIPCGTIFSSEWTRNTAGGTLKAGVTYQIRDIVVEMGDKESYWVSGIVTIPSETQLAVGARTISLGTVAYTDANGSNLIYITDLYIGPSLQGIVKCKQISILNNEIQGITDSENVYFYYRELN